MNRFSGRTRSETLSKRCKMSNTTRQQRKWSSPWFRRVFPKMEVSLAMITSFEKERSLLLACRCGGTRRATRTTSDDMHALLANSGAFEIYQRSLISAIGEILERSEYAGKEKFRQIDFRERSSKISTFQVRKTCQAAILILIEQGLLMPGKKVVGLGKEGGRMIEQRE